MPRGGLRGGRIGHRPVGRHTTVVVAPRRRVMPMAGTMMMGMATGMMMGGMMGMAMAGGRRQSAHHCECKEEANEIIIIIHQPGIVVAKCHDKQWTYETVKPGYPIPPDFVVVYRPDQQGVSVAKQHHEKVEFEVIPVGHAIPKNSKLVKIQILPVTVIHRQENGQTIQQAIPLGKPIPPGSTVVELPMGVPGTLVQFNQPDGGIIHGIIPPNHPFPPNAIVIGPVQLNPAPPQAAPAHSQDSGAVEQQKDASHDSMSSDVSRDGVSVDNSPSIPPLPSPYGDSAISDSSAPPSSQYPPDVMTMNQAPPSAVQYPPDVMQPPTSPQQVPVMQPGTNPGFEYHPSTYGAPAPAPAPSHDPYRSVSAPAPAPSTSYSTSYSTERRKSGPPPTWVPDEEAPKCHRCKNDFTFTNRRHHCRNCGNVFCGACSNNMARLPQYGFNEPVRVCFDCFKDITGKEPTITADSGCVIV